MRTVALCFLTAHALSCTKRTEPATTEAAPVVDPLAGRTRHTIVYSGNLWGDLLECG